MSGPASAPRWSTPLPKQRRSAVVCWPGSDTRLAGADGSTNGTIRDGVKALGIDQADAEYWIQGVIKARPDDKHEYVLSPGFKPGFTVSYDLRYDGSKATQVIIVSVCIC